MITEHLYAVETSSLTKQFGDLKAVDGISLNVRAGEVYGFLGPNGAGKTTTLRMILGLIKPTSGTVKILGTESGSLDDVGALIEGPAFYPYLSGAANLRVCADTAGVSKARVSVVLEQVDLADRAGDKYSTYSLGMKQRLGLAAALLKDPQVVILDEPANGLDPQGIADMRTTLRGLADEGRTVLLSSHLLSEVQHTCDRVAIVDKGVLLAETNVEDIRSSGYLHVAVDRSARSVLERIADRITETTGGFDLAVSPSESARINTALVTAGFEVSELRWRERDLEEIFFALTSQTATEAVR